MDTELILYIIFIAIAIITRLLKSKKEGNKPTPSQQVDTMDQPQRRPEKTKSFEELLREFTGEEQSPPQPFREEKPYVQEEVYSYEDEYGSDEEIKESYNRSVNEAKKLKTLDEQVSLNEPLQRMEHFKKYEVEEENTVANDIFETLRDADGARKAVILSEIINRKY